MGILSIHNEGCGVPLTRLETGFLYDEICSDLSFPMTFEGIGKTTIKLKFLPNSIPESDINDIYVTNITGSSNMHFEYNSAIVQIGDTIDFSAGFLYVYIDDYTTIDETIRIYFTISVDGYSNRSDEVSYWYTFTACEHTTTTTFPAETTTTTYECVVNPPTINDISYDNTTTTTTLALAPEYYSCYGFFYNYYAATDARKITSSDDWRVPTRTEFEAMLEYVGGSPYNPTFNRWDDAGGYLKETGTGSWDSPNTAATDTYGFKARGVGIRYADEYPPAYALFEDIRITGVIGTQTQYDYGFYDGQNWYGWYGYIFYYNQNYVSLSTDPVVSGHSLRLVKTATGVSDGTYTVYTGNDGKTYNAVVINELYWTTRNLEETQYRNLDYITGASADGYIPMSNDDWAVLSEGALSLYDNTPAYACEPPDLVTTTTTATS